MATQNSVIPSFFLFGEPPKEVSDRFIHLESLDDRTRPSHWNIRPHAHGSLNHIFFIAQGRGVMRAEACDLTFAAPSLLMVPACVVHGFTFEPETTGQVLTLADSYLRNLAEREPAFLQLFSAPARLDVHSSAEVSAALATLSRELSWSAPGHAVALEAHLMSVLVTALRLSHHAAAAAPLSDSSTARLVARFRELVEQDYRSAAGVEDYAGRLAVSSDRLRRACLSVAQRAPLEMIHDRLMLEAKRALIYSDMTVTEIGLYLGFDDPAYFSRFFSSRAELSPRNYRASRRS